MTATLPKLLGRKELAEMLGVRTATAENLMRKLPKVKIGRRVFVRDSDVLDYLSKEAKS